MNSCTKNPSAESTEGQGSLLVCYCLSLHSAIITLHTPSFLLSSHPTVLFVEDRLPLTMLSFNLIQRLRSAHAQIIVRTGSQSCQSEQSELITAFLWPVPLPPHPPSSYVSTQTLLLNPRHKKSGSDESPDRNVSSAASTVHPLLFSFFSVVF